MVRKRLSQILAILVLSLGSWTAWTGRFLRAQPAPSPFETLARPFLMKNCAACHNEDNPTAGVRVDHLGAAFEDRHIRLWECIRHRIKEGTMPPKGLPQPSEADRQAVVEWIGRNLEAARLRPAPKNGMVRRLTVAQYRNTLRELLLLDDELTEGLPPDAVSRDGFVNNKETLQLSPLLLEAYLQIAEEALNRAIIDPDKKPHIQNFRVDLGEGVNPNPIPDKLVLGALSELLDNSDVLVTQLTPAKPFPYEPFFMRTKYRFIEGYAGNDTVRGWREFDSIYHAVFACMRGSRGYPKGRAYSTVPEGLLLRPAIPNEEQFDEDGTYGPKANFKISLRELPDEGRFRVTVLAAKYDDGLLLDPGAEPQPEGNAIVAQAPGGGTEVTIPAAGVYQVDIHEEPLRPSSSAPDASRLSEGLAGHWQLEGPTPEAQLEDNASFAGTPFGRGLLLDGERDFIIYPRNDSMNVGEGDFTVTAWIHPKELRRAGIIGLGAYEWSQGWYLDMGGERGLRLETAGPEAVPNGSVSAVRGVIREGVWQHVAAVVRRSGESRLYVNGYLVGRGRIGPANLDNPKMNLQIGRVIGSPGFHGQIDEVRLYRRAIDEAELQALLEPGREFVQPPPDRPQDVTLTLGGRRFSGTLVQPAFLLVRLPAGPLRIRTSSNGTKEIGRAVLTPLGEGTKLAKRFTQFEKRSPRVGVHLGLRRDCGSTLAPVGPPQTVSSTALTRYVFEGAIRNFPSPEVEKDNVNYLAGIQEIGVRSEYTDGRDMPRLLIRSVEFEGPLHETWPPPSHRNIFVDFARKQDQPAYARHIVANFATRAYRRPLAPGELDALMNVYRRSSQSGRGFRESVKDTLQVVLTSPQFLFLTETSATPAPEPLDDYELASKLSYFLWNGPPDGAALKLASAGALRRRLDSEVTRMIADARFSRFIQEFAYQWLNLDKFAVLEPDRKRFPKLSRHVRAHLQQEPVRFVEHLFRNNLPVRHLIDSDFVTANEAVADYYGFGEKSESGFEFLPLAHGRRELGGLLTQPAILAGLSDGRESNPVKRGAWLARRIIAEPPADPPPNVPALKDEDPNLTLRQRLEEHRNQPGCRQCHQTIDPWGIALEEFDAGGLLKPEPADARSTLPDRTEVAGILDLKRYLAEDRIDQVAFSVLKHLAVYANGRGLTYNEVNDLKQEGRKLKANGYRMQDMIRFLAGSKYFLEK
jgi:mono/diheme cytochrome c family protein